QPLPHQPERQDVALHAADLHPAHRRRRGGRRGGGAARGRAGRRAPRRRRDAGPRGRVVSPLAPTLSAARLAAALWRAPRRGGPLKITAVLTERCHLRCDFCRLWEAPDPGVPTATWIEFFRANPFLRWVNLTGGELFAKERLDELLDGIVAALPRLELLDFPT